jgi:hypothetical protein
MRGPTDEYSADLIRSHPGEELTGGERNRFNGYANFAGTRLRSAVCAPVLDSFYVDGDGR